MGVTLKTAVPVVGSLDLFVAVNVTCTVSPIFGSMRFAALKSQFRPFDVLASKVTGIVRSRMTSEYCSVRWVVPL